MELLVEQPMAQKIEEKVEPNIDAKKDMGDTKPLIKPIEPLDIKERFKHFLENKGLKERTLFDYFYYYNKFDLEKLSQDYVNEFILENKHNCIVRAFIKNLLYFLKNKEIEIPQLTGRKKKRLPRVTNEEEVGMIYKAMANQRNKLMLILTYYCGLRAGELMKIKISDFKWSQIRKLSKGELFGTYGELKVYGKGDKERIALVPGQIMFKIAKFINANGEKYVDKKELFQLSQRRWSTILDVAAMKSLGKKINPHSLRHGIATDLLKKGMDIRYIKEVLGHSSISSTEIYTHVSKDELREKMIKFNT